MQRRTFLGSVGALASVGALGYATRGPVESIDVRFWFSERASEYDRAVDRIREYVDFAFDDLRWTTNVSFGGTVSIDTEDAYRALVGGEWPSRVLGGKLGDEAIDPVRDVNLLVTDGQIENTPTGGGLPHLATVGGARHLADARPIDAQPTVTPYTTPNRVMQVLIHEIGHALGLEHDHGVAFRRGDVVVATPMISAYAWDPEYDGDRSACGAVYPDVEQHRRGLTFSFSTCARRELREYAGGFVPRG